MLDRPALRGPLVVAIAPHTDYLDDGDDRAENCGRVNVGGHKWALSNTPTYSIL